MVKTLNKLGMTWKSEKELQKTKYKPLILTGKSDTFNLLNL
jgi:hypothetical protein